MPDSKVSWKLRNIDNDSLAKHVKRLGNLLLRTSPNEYVILSMTIVFHNGEQQYFDVNRWLDKQHLKSIRRFLKKNQDKLQSFQLHFVNFNQRENIQIMMTGQSPFEQLTLQGLNLPHWLHEMTNRRFNHEISLSQKIWSYCYNHRPFKYSLTRNTRI